MSDSLSEAFGAITVSNGKSCEASMVLVIVVFRTLPAISVILNVTLIFPVALPTLSFFIKYGLPGTSSICPVSFP
ncbi:MAG TPA: hypothetical protein PK746_05005 [Spirochaetales bacterium]|nr:hypothetical protein [Spirochaetales bacterium]